MTISRFSGDYAFLSNFYYSPFSAAIPQDLSGTLLSFPTVEHYFQACKAKNAFDGLIIAHANSPSRAKALGRKCELADNWYNNKIHVMQDALAFKFDTPESNLGKLLLSTGTKELIEGNDWNDSFWGVCKGVGENNLGKLLMARRDYLRNMPAGWLA
jgi:ribA/ribD-fused uncharacterized protein